MKTAKQPELSCLCTREVFTSRVSLTAVLFAKRCPVFWQRFIKLGASVLQQCLADAAGASPLSFWVPGVKAGPAACSHLCRWAGKRMFSVFIPVSIVGYRPLLRSYSHSAPWNWRQQFFSLCFSRPSPLAFLQQSMARCVAACSATRIAGCFESCYMQLLSVLLSRHHGVSVLKVSSLENLLWQQVTWLQSLGGSIKPISPCVKERFFNGCLP